MKKHSNYLMKHVQKDLNDMTNKELLNVHNIFCNGWPIIGSAPGKKEKSFPKSSRQYAITRTLNVVLYCYFWVWEKENEKTQLNFMPLWTDKVDPRKQYYDTCRLLLNMKIKYYNNDAVETATYALTRNNKRITFL